MWVYIMRERTLYKSSINQFRFKNQRLESQRLISKDILYYMNSLTKFCQKKVLDYYSFPIFLIGKYKLKNTKLTSVENYKRKEKDPAMK